MNKTPFLLTSAIVLAMGTGFGGKPPKDPEVENETKAKVTTPETGKVALTSLGLRLIIEKKGTDFVLGKNANILFEQRVGSDAQASIRCEMPLVVSVEGNRKALDASVTRSIKKVFKKMKTPPNETRMDFMTGFFQEKGGDVAPLTEGVADALIGKYTFKDLPALKKFEPETTQAPVSEKGIGFIVGVDPAFKERLAVSLDFSPQDDTGTNALCQKILKNGFKLVPPKSDA